MNRLGQRRCAYCDKSGVMTKEHIWPAALHRRVMEDGDGGRSQFWIARFGKYFESDPTVRDVCGECNNGPLSRLDAYGCALFDRQFSKILARYEKVELTYDYHLLKQWLLKLSFNSARVNGSVDEWAFPPLVPYILGHDLAVGRSVQLYLQLTYPGLIPRSFFKDIEPLEQIPSIFYPTLIRMGHAMVVKPAGARRILRAVHLYSYSFFLVLFDPREGARAKTAMPPEVESAFHGAKLLRPSRPVEHLECNGADAWKSFSKARDFRFSNKSDLDLGP